MSETDPIPPSSPSPPAPSARRTGFLRVMLAVFWSFFGVRKGRDLLADGTDIKPQHLIAAGLLGGLMLVVTLLLLVRLIIRSVGA
jgi:hypothetical protein